MTHAHCTFCSIVDGTTPAVRIYEDDHVLSFMDALPMTPGHALLIPKRHVENAFGLTSQDGGPLIAAVAHVGNMIVERLGAKGLNVLNNNGRAADQSQFHVHFHLIPRYGNDRLLHPWERQFGHWPEIREIARVIRGEIERSLQ